MRLVFWSFEQKWRNFSLSLQCFFIIYPWDYWLDQTKSPIFSREWCLQELCQFFGTRNATKKFCGWYKYDCIQIQKLNSKWGSRQNPNWPQFNKLLIIITIEGWDYLTLNCNFVRFIRYFDLNPKFVFELGKLPLWIIFLWWIFLKYSR